MERTSSAPVIVMGSILIALGLLYFLVEVVHVDRDTALHYGWPGLVILPGVVLAVIGMSVEDVNALCIPGAVVTVAGVVLIIQNRLHLFGALTYTWALAVPGGIGLGMWLQGMVYASAGLRASGLYTMGVGVVLFLAGFVLFERILHVSGVPKNVFRDFILSVLLPLVIIVAGFVLLVRRPRPASR